MEKHEKIIYELTEWIDQNIERPLKIQDIAEKAGYSKWHLQRMFYRVMDISLGHYVRDKKLRLAAWDLISSKESVIAISLKYGYDNQQSFTRTFSKKYHVPPSTFRRLKSHHDDSGPGYMI